MNDTTTSLSDFLNRATSVLPQQDEDGVISFFDHLKTWGAPIEIPDDAYFAEIKVSFEGVPDHVFDNTWIKATELLRDTHPNGAFLRQIAQTWFMSKPGLLLPLNELLTDEGNDARRGLWAFALTEGQHELLSHLLAGRTLCQRHQTATDVENIILSINVDVLQLRQVFPEILEQIFQRFEKFSTRRTGHVIIPVYETVIRSLFMEFDTFFARNLHHLDDETKTRILSASEKSPFLCEQSFLKTMALRQYLHNGISTEQNSSKPPSKL